MRLQLNIQEARRAIKERAGASRGTILIVDDERANLDGLEAALGRDYTLRAATSGEEALALEGLEEVDVVISDQRMPRMLGTELLAALAARFPRQQRILLTGYTDASDLIRCINEGLLHRYLVKPWHPDELRAVIGQCFEQLEMQRQVSAQARQLRLEVEERRRAQAELERALYDLKEAQGTLIAQERLRALGEMVSGVAHDFNNLLTPILVYAQELLAPLQGEEEPLEEGEQREALSHIISAAEDGVHLIERLKAAHHPQHVPSDHTALIDLRALVLGAVALALPRWQRRRAERGLPGELLQLDLLALDPVELARRRDEADPERCLCVQVSLDPALSALGLVSDLRQALVNLLSNAIDALAEVIDAGTLPELTARLYRDGERACIEICDNGPGMSPEVLARCSDPFYSTKGDGGSGLGLAMVFQAAERHHGALELLSTPGEGTTARLSLPLPSPQP